MVGRTKLFGYGSPGWKLCSDAGLVRAIYVCIHISNVSNQCLEIVEDAWRLLAVIPDCYCSNWMGCSQRLPNPTHVSPYCKAHFALTNVKPVMIDRCFDINKDMLCINFDRATCPPTASETFSNSKQHISAKVCEKPVRVPPLQ